MWCRDMQRSGMGYFVALPAPAIWSSCPILSEAQSHFLAPQTILGGGDKLLGTSEGYFFRRSRKV